MSNKTDGIYYSSSNIPVIAEVAFCDEVDTIQVYVGYTVFHIPEIPLYNCRMGFQFSSLILIKLTHNKVTGLFNAEVNLRYYRNVRGAIINAIRFV
jgi:hypothetical protein